MKFNWGHGITIFIIAFVGFILLMVVKAFNTSTDLTAENYYSQELSYGERITAISNSNKLSTDFQVLNNGSAIEVTLPQELQGAGVTGQIYFYRPDNAAMDFTVAIDAQKSKHVISNSALVSGNYSLQVSCTKGEREYYFEQPITISKER